MPDAIAPEPRQSNTATIDPVIADLEQIPTNDMDRLSHFFEYPHDRLIVEGERAFCGYRALITGPSRRIPSTTRRCQVCMAIWNERKRSGGGR